VELVKRLRQKPDTLIGASKGTSKKLTFEKLDKIENKNTT